jgi:hypothetical protein
MIAHHQPKRACVHPAGVMYINVTAFGAERPAMIEWGEQHMFPGAFDQTIINGYLGNRTTLLPDTFNWKGYWGWAPSIKIVHFHGPKPGKCLDCLVVSTVQRSDRKLCKCASVYHLLWNKANDGGSFFTGALLMFYHYLLQAQGGPHPLALQQHSIEDTALNVSIPSEPLTPGPRVCRAGLCQFPRLWQYTTMTHMPGSQGASFYGELGHSTSYRSLALSRKQPLGAVRSSRQPAVACCLSTSPSSILSS